MKTIAIIPARGGSKGISRKNLVCVNGKPMIVWSIEQALDASKVDRVVVSTDDEEIAEVSRNAGAEVPFIRPAELAADQVLDLPVFEHALKYLKATEHYVPDLVVHLRPTAPIRDPCWIDDAIQLLATDPNADSVRSVSEPDKHPYRMFRIGGDGYLDAIMKHEHPVPYLLRRQDLPPMYYYNCVIDVTRPTTIFKKHSMTGDYILPYITPADMTFDVDTPRDLEVVRLFAEKML